MSENRPDFGELVGDDLPAGEEERLRGAHELLLAAGPLPELPPSLARAPEVEDPYEASAAFSLLPRRGGRMLTLAAAFAVLTLIVGYVVGSRHGGFDTHYTVAMRGTAAAPQATGLIRVGHIDSVGNWPLEVQVAGLRRLPRGSYYTLYLTRNRKPAAECGTFRVHEGETTVRMNAPYNFRRYDGWVVVATGPGEKEGPPLLQKFFSS